MKMKSNESVIEFSNRIEILKNDIAAIGNGVTDIEKKRKFMAGLMVWFYVTSRIILSTRLCNF